MKVPAQNERLDKGMRANIPVLWLARMGTCTPVMHGWFFFFYEKITECVVSGRSVPFLFARHPSVFRYHSGNIVTMVSSVSGPILGQYLSNLVANDFVQRMVS